MIALVFVQWAYIASLSSLGPLLSNPFAVAMTLLLVTLMAVAVVWCNDLLNAVILVALIAHSVFSTFSDPTRSRRVTRRLPWEGARRVQSRAS